MNVKEMSATTVCEEMPKNNPDDKYIPYGRLKDSSVEKSRLTPATSLTEVCFFFSQLNLRLEKALD